MLILTHRLALFTGLTPSEPAHYGFNATQVAIDPFTPGNLEGVLPWVAGLSPNLNLLLAFTPQPDNRLFTGGPDEAWYATFAAGLQELKNRLGTRVVGLRFNHEYRSSAFAATPAWESWLRSVDLAMWTYVVNYQRAKWNKLLVDTKSAIHPVQFLERTTGTDYDSPAWTDFRQTFQHWVNYQNQREAVVINRLAGMASGRGLPFYLYPGGHNATVSPRLLPELEYTVQQQLTDPARVILEAGGWSSFSPVWVNTVAGSIRQPWITTLQLDLRYLEGADPVAETAGRLPSRNALGQPPQGFGLWCDWNPASRPELRAGVQRYLNGVRQVLSR